MHSGGDSTTTAKKQPWRNIGIVVALAFILAIIIWLVVSVVLSRNVQIVQSQDQPTGPKIPKLETQELVKGYSPIWDIAFLPSKEMLFTERKGIVHIFKDGKASRLAAITDVFAQGEGGLLGLAVDPKFDTNRYIYTCFNSTLGNDVRVVRWRLADDKASLGDRKDIITGIPANPTANPPARHSGCRIAFGPDGYLWVGTGDAAKGDTSIQPKSLGGKILRVDGEGKPAPGNVGGQFDVRIYSYGHRNVQGLAFFAEPKDGVLGINTEHGSNIDDEVNLLKPGNFGWAPPAKGYDETNVPMTNKARFPDAIDALWKSGQPTLAVSGATFLKGDQWGAWQGNLVVATLKAQHLQLITLDAQNKVASEQPVFTNMFGRIRTAVQGPDGNLYISTDNAADNKIIRITPR